MTNGKQEGKRGGLAVNRIEKDAIFFSGSVFFKA